MRVLRASAGHTSSHDGMYHNSAADHQQAGPSSRIREGMDPRVGEAELQIGSFHSCGRPGPVQPRLSRSHPVPELRFNCSTTTCSRHAPIRVPGFRNLARGFRSPRMPHHPHRHGMPAILSNTKLMSAASAGSSGLLAHLNAAPVKMTTATSTQRLPNVARFQRRTLPLQVVRVVIARGEHIRSQHNAPLHSTAIQPPSFQYHRDQRSTSAPAPIPAGASYTPRAGLHRRGNPCRRRPDAGQRLDLAHIGDQLLRRLDPAFTFPRTPASIHSKYLRMPFSSPSRVVQHRRIILHKPHRRCRSFGSRPAITFRTIATSATQCATADA